MAEEARRMLEEMYLSAAEKGEKKAMLLVLEHADLFDVNCTDGDESTALMLALENRNIDMIEILLTEKRVQMGDILLRAVNAQFTPAVVAICKAVKARKELPGGLFCHSENGDFHPDMTPAVLAAQHNLFDILKVLIEYGATIDDPDLCEFNTEEFTLEHSVGRINVYRALTAVACICLTNTDPLEAAFKLSRKMRKLSESDFEFRAQYEQMAESCEEFAAELIDYIRDSKEQNIALTHDPKEWSRDSFRGDFKEPFKVKTAITYDQKQFVAHPHCQQSLVERWYKGLETYRRMKSMKQIFLSLLFVLCFPFISACYIVAPKRKPGVYLNTPYVRYLCHAGSQILFLTFLVVHFVHSSSKDKSEKDDRKEVGGMDIAMSVWDWMIVFFLLAMTWKEVTTVVNKGMTPFKENLQGKVFDMIVIFLYWGWLLCRFYVIWQFQFQPKTELVPALMQNESVVVSSPIYYSPSDDNAMLMEVGNDTDLNELRNKLAVTMQQEKYLQDQLDKLLTDRQYSQEDPESEDSSYNHRVKRSPARVKIGGSAKQGTSSTPYVGTNLTTMSAISATHPLLIGEGMLAIAKVFSFLSVARMTVVHLHIGPMQISFGRMGSDIVKFLVLFSLILVAFAVGMSELYHLYTMDLMNDCIKQAEPRCRIPYKDFQAAFMSLFWSLFGMTPIETLEVSVLNHWVTEMVGYILFALYQVIAIVALLNILIAMMSNTYTRIEDDSDIQWKFARSTLWMTYYEESSSLSPPFNLIPSVGTIKAFCASKFLKGKKARYRKKSLAVEIKDQEYKSLMQELVKRFIFSKKGDEDSSAQETWMLQLKQEVSGFKYDMFENLGNLSKTVSNIHKSVDENAPEDGGQFGSEFLKNMENVVKHAEDVALPVRPDIFTNSGNGDDQPSEVVYADYEMEEEL
ncbi:short transient receptor potential channel 5-like [Ptychodera flava]|uniref:short transient receptor potential channel 5-like n=1 Tax=Ptychodera flava TaxID=63121 RepID=UPI00396A5EF6